MRSRRALLAPSLCLVLLVPVLSLPACGPSGPLEELAPVQGEWIDPSLAPDWQPPAAGHGLDEALAAEASPDPVALAAGDKPADDLPTTPEASDEPPVAPSTGEPAPDPALAAASEAEPVVAPEPPAAAIEPSPAVDDGWPAPRPGALLELEFEDLALPEGALDAVAADDTSAVTMPDQLLALDGRQVALAGFLIPTSEGGSHMRRFALSYDPPGCCFGEAGSLDKWVVVELEEDADPVEYRFWGVVRVEGLLSVGARRSEYGHLESLYRLRGVRGELIE